MKANFKKAASYFYLIIAAVVLAFNYYLFVTENNFAPAGLTGIATMVQYKTGFSISYMSLIISVPLCVAAYFLVEKEFGIKSLMVVVIFSSVLLALQKSGLGFIQYNADGHDTIFPAIISGVITGIVYGVCVLNNASTGGTDVISRYINKVKPEANFFIMVFALNSAVAISSLFVYSDVGVIDYRPVALCVTYCFVSNFVGSYIIKETKVAYKFTVITNNAEDIAKEVSDKLHHSSTRISAVGSYTNSEKTLLICVVNKNQINDFKKILSKYKDTFAFCDVVNETYGNFLKIK